MYPVHLFFFFAVQDQICVGKVYHEDGFYACSVYVCYRKMMPSMVGFMPRMNSEPRPKKTLVAQSSQGQPFDEPSYIMGASKYSVIPHRPNSFLLVNPPPQAPRLQLAGKYL